MTGQLVSLFRFIDGPLMDQASRREEVVRRMAKDLIEGNAIGIKDEAIDTLLRRGYPTFDVFALVDDARQAAHQELVAVEMSLPQEAMP